MIFSGGKFLIVGVSKSGVAACEALISLGAKIYLYDELEMEIAVKNKAALSELGAVPVSDKELDAVLDEVDVVVLSPGVPIDNALPVAARSKNKRIIGETELGAILCRAVILAVTGTNGKTTVVSMINAILQKDGRHSFALGNIGTPLSSKALELDFNDVAVVEVSSFQLETIHSFCPHVAVITNVTPDHLNRHYNMENYLYLKGRILSNMRESEYAVLNYDDKSVRSLSDRTKAKCVYFSLAEKVNGSYISGGKIYYGDEYLFELNDLALKEEHNECNALASICVAKIMGVSGGVIRAALSEFKGAKHRIQFVKTVNGISFYNDSKSTNVDSSLKAIAAMKKPTVIILGGKDKDQNFDKLFEEIKLSVVTHAVLIGEAKYKLLESAKKADMDRLTLCNDFESAVKIASLQSETGGNVLLSPACSSFDMFSSYSERGDKFIEIVEALS